MGQYQDLAREIATNYGVDPALICAIVEQESGWIPWATRYEPAFESKYIEPIAVQNTLTPTEIKGRSTSYGLMQVMGETARELGFTGRFLTQLCDPSTGITFGCKKFIHCLARSSGDVQHALDLYNGGGNQSYASQVLARVPHYK